MTQKEMDYLLQALRLNLAETHKSPPRREEDVKKPQSVEEAVSSPDAGTGVRSEATQSETTTTIIPFPDDDSDSPCDIRFVIEWVQHELVLKMCDGSKNMLRHELALSKCEPPLGIMKLREQSSQLLFSKHSRHVPLRITRFMERDITTCAPASSNEFLSMCLWAKRQVSELTCNASVHP
jgi:hypothetical protein